ncbi:AAA family ATPase [Desulfobacter latus]|uniref:non-specific protein-tyrosine kinase n=1 Tax=Desulfobacter latus TaxID=2292 RepID=A0A850T1Z1_9BACT|nr:AAA family ATPase [Desulfobacter latus]NWH06370.1 AAA family ATPase [Desulfobacter latus]
MKLKKALDQAKAQREQQNPAPVPNPDKATDLSLGTNSTSEQDGIWKAPAYNRSAVTKLDPKIVEKNRGVCLTPDHKEIERYKILRTRITNIARERRMRTIMVTSPNKSEGKTVNCINMGLTFAKAMKQTVLLVDCDFNGQDIHRYLGIESKASLIDYFMDGVPLQDLIVWPGVEKLTLISGARTINESSELLSSNMMAKLVKEMGERYDDRYVFFDAPPVLGHAEAISLAPRMDGILMVVEAGKTTKTDVKESLALLPKEKFLGFLLNKQTA